MYELSRGGPILQHKHAQIWAQAGFFPGVAHDLEQAVAPHLVIVKLFTVLKSVSATSLKRLLTINNFVLPRPAP